MRFCFRREDTRIIPEVRHPRPTGHRDCRIPARHEDPDAETRPDLILTDLSISATGVMRETRVPRNLPALARVTWHRVGRGCRWPGFHGMCSPGKIRRPVFVEGALVLHGSPERGGFPSSTSRARRATRPSRRWTPYRSRNSVFVRSGCWVIRWPVKKDRIIPVNSSGFRPT